MNRKYILLILFITTSLSALAQDPANLGVEVARQEWRSGDRCNRPERIYAGRCRYRGMVQLFGNEEGAAMVTTSQWDTVAQQKTIEQLKKQISQVHK